MFVIEDKKEAIMHFINGTFVHSWFQFMLWRAPRISPLSCQGEGGGNTSPVGAVFAERPI